MLELVAKDGERVVVDPLRVGAIVELHDGGAAIIVDSFEIVLRDKPRHVAASIMEARKKAEPQYVNEFGHPDP